MLTRISLGTLNFLRLKYSLLLLLTLLFVVACQPKTQKQTLTGIIGSWYGFYPLYYAKELGIADKHGIELRIIEAGAALDLRRGYLKPSVHFMATSLVEVSNAYMLNDGQVELLLVTDFSNGSDLIVAKKNVGSLEQLVDKRIGADSFSVGLYVLKRALIKYGLDSDINHVVVGSDAYLEAFEKDLIDAAVTYPPFSSQLTSSDDYHVLYSTAEDPGKVFDTLMVKTGVSEEVKAKLWKIWFETVEHILANPQQYASYLAKITDDSMENIIQELAGIKFVTVEEYLGMVADQVNFRNELRLACMFARNEPQACRDYARQLTIRTDNEN